MLTMITFTNVDDEFFSILLDNSTVGRRFRKTIDINFMQRLDSLLQQTKHENFTDHVPTVTKKLYAGILWGVSHSMPDFDDKDSELMRTIMNANDFTDVYSPSLTCFTLRAISQYTDKLALFNTISFFDINYLDTMREHWATVDIIKKMIDDYNRLSPNDILKQGTYMFLPDYDKSNLDSKYLLDYTEPESEEFTKNQEGRKRW